MPAILPMFSAAGFRLVSGGTDSAHARGRLFRCGGQIAEAALEAGITVNRMRSLNQGRWLRAVRISTPSPRAGCESDMDTVGELIARPKHRR
jgi:hypothetical protein